MGTRSAELGPAVEAFADHADLEKRVHALEIKLSTQSGIAGKIVIALAWLVTTAIAFYNLFRR